MNENVKKSNRLVPSRALLILMLIGFADLVMTAVLHAQGLIVELNPVMKPFIERSEWLFAGVKGLTLLAAYLAMVWYAEHNLHFVRKACRAGVVLYLGIWIVWFTAAM
jgi:hypothetical protein